MAMLILRLVFPVTLTVVGLFLWYDYYQLEDPGKDLLYKAIGLTVIGLVWTIFRFVRWWKGAYGDR